MACDILRSIKGVEVELCLCKCSDGGRCMGIGFMKGMSSENIIII